MTNSLRMLALTSATILLSWITAAAQNANTTRNLSSFDEVDISGGFEEVAFVEGSSESVAIDASGIDLEKIVTEVKGNTLKIGMKNGRYNNAKIKITVTYRSLKEISNSGSTNVVVRSTIKGEEFEYNASGSGNFSGAFEVKELEVNISGSSDVTLSGTATEQEYAISGSGDIKAGSLKGARAEVAISGSGDVELNVDGPVQTAIAGSGNVRNKKQ